MKTIRLTVYTVTILLTLFASLLYAASSRPVKSNRSSSHDTEIDLRKYTFTVPMEADFSDSDPEMIYTAPAPSMNALKPTAPTEATFEDAEDVYNMPIPERVMNKLAPVAPKTAEFGDLYEAVPNLILDLAPVAPLTADFEEN